MQWIYEDCVGREIIEEHFDIITNEINKMVKKYYLNSLDTIIVCGNSREEFEKVVKDNYKEKNIEIDDDNIYGQVIEYEKDGEIRQKVIFKEDVIIALLCVMGAMQLNDISCEKNICDIALIFYHELGHVFDNQKHYYIDIDYNWQGNIEGKEILEREVYSFLGEYYAQYIAIKEGQTLIKCIDNRLEDLIREINNKLDQKYLKGHNILYYFAHYCAFCSFFKCQINFDELSNRIEDNNYVCGLKKIKNILWKMKAIYPKKNEREDVLDLMICVEECMF